MTARATFKEADVTRFANGLRKAKLPVFKVTVDANGVLSAYTSPAESVSGTSWDDLLAPPPPRFKVQRSPR